MAKELKVTENAYMSGLPMEAEENVLAQKKVEITTLMDTLKGDQTQRRSLYQRRYDFYIGNHNGYTTLYGVTAKPKSGHPTAVFNYAGKTAKKIATRLSVNHPQMSIPAQKVIPEEYVEEERARAQAVEDFTDKVLADNNFWLSPYRRAVFNQVNMGDAAIKTYPVKENNEWTIKIVNHERMDNILVAWRGDDPTKYDAVICLEWRTAQSIQNEFGVTLPESEQTTKKEMQDNNVTGSSNWAEGKHWEAKDGQGKATGETDAPGFLLVEYDSADLYAIMVNGKFIEYVVKDGVRSPKVSYWTIVHNTPQPRSPWSLSDLDDLIEPQIELNETINDERGYIRVGANQRYVAYNMEGFDPNSLKTNSGGVVFVNSADGSSRFEPLATNVNVFPIDSYINRVQASMFDLGVPKVAFGSSGADSGRSKSIDYQSMVDVVEFKQGDWELALTDIAVKIQLMGEFYFGSDDGETPGVQFFKSPDTETFMVRRPEYDWDEVMPITQSDKIVNVLNKVTMGLPFRIAFKELGYRDPDAIIAEMKREAKDPELMTIRSKMYQLSEGLLAAQSRAQQVLQSQEAPPPAAPPSNGGEMNQSAPMMVPSQGGSQNPMPMAQRGGTTVFSTPSGRVNQLKQNAVAAGR